jgi:hypothetical protein
VVWNDSLLPTGHGDTNAINAPFSFFAALANGIALARSELYRDQNGHNIFDYTNSLVFSNTNTVGWPVTAIANGLAAVGETCNLYSGRCWPARPVSAQPAPPQTGLIRFLYESRQCAANGYRRVFIYRKRKTPFVEVVCFVENNHWPGYARNLTF